MYISQPKKQKNRWKTGTIKDDPKIERVQVSMSTDELEIIRTAAHCQDRKICNFVLHAALKLARDYHQGAELPHQKSDVSTIISK